MIFSRLVLLYKFKIYTVLKLRFIQRDTDGTFVGQDQSSIYDHNFPKDYRLYLFTE